MPRTLQSLSLDARVRVYGRVLEARRDRGSTCETIARQLDLPSSTVYNWIVGKNSPLGSIVVPILTPSPSLSYLAGAMLGDGDLVRSTSYHYQLRLRVKDQDFAEKVCSCYSSVLGRPRKVRKDGSGFCVVGFGVAYFTNTSQILAQFRKQWIGFLPNLSKDLQMQKVRPQSQ